MSSSTVKESSAVLDGQPIVEQSIQGAGANKLKSSDRRFHDWYRFVLSFPPHLVRKYLNEFCGTDSTMSVLDPFCGTGTTLLESKLSGFSAFGIEANPFPQFASATKLNWEISVDGLLECADKVANSALQQLERQGISDEAVGGIGGFAGNLMSLPSEQEELLLTDSISPLPLHKILTLLHEVENYQSKSFHSHLLIALGKVLVFRASNLKFGPEVGLGIKKVDASVVTPWREEVARIADDIGSVQKTSDNTSVAYLGDAREINRFMPARSIDVVITSPPYPNEKDYTRTTRLESVILGFIKSKQELRQFKKSLVRSNTRGVYKEDDDHLWIAGHPTITEVAERIERRRLELKKTSGFERLYARVTQLYFGGMARHLQELQPVLKPGARLAYVVGDQASYLRVMIRTGQILAEVATKLGYHVDRIDLFRTRFATATGEQLREEVVVLTWPG